MIGKRYLLVLLVIVMASACSDTRPGQSAKSLPDNPENRTVLAKQYLEIMKPKDMLQSVANRVVPRLPEKDRKSFTDIMNSPAIEKSADRITLDGLVKHFTVGELNAMLAFYGSPDGQSAAKKYGWLYGGNHAPDSGRSEKGRSRGGKANGAPKTRYTSPPNGTDGPQGAQRSARQKIGASAPGTWPAKVWTIFRSPWWEGRKVLAFRRGLWRAGGAIKTGPS